jgi:hypothetical protein
MRRFTTLRIRCLGGCLCLLLSLSGAAAAPPKAPYDAGKVTEPRLFGEGVISTEDDEVNGSFSPDGTEYYFSKVIPYTSFPRLGILCVSRFQNGKWTEPEVVPFSGQFLDLTPRFSPDGGRMFFTSSRPAPGKTQRVLRVWSIDRTTAGWSEPQPLPAPINADDSWNWAGSVSRDGTLYFTSTRDGTGHPHVFRSRWVNGAYSEPEKLGPEINSAFNESDPYISPDGSVLIFASSGDGLPGAGDRPETLKGGGVRYSRADLYVSISANGHWSKARHLEHDVNTTFDEGSPSLTPDGKYLFFSSERSPFTVPTDHALGYAEIEKMLHSTLNGHGNIFFISTSALEIPVEKEAK